MCPAKIRLPPVWPESSLGTFWIASDAKSLHKDNKDWSDWVDVQSDLDLRWLLMSKGTFSHLEAYMNMDVQTDYGNCCS